MIKQLWYIVFIVKTINAVYEPCAGDTSGFCEHTCCHEKLKCDEVGGKPIYLGADSMIGIPQGNQGYHLFFSYRFMGIQLLKISKYIKPSDPDLYRWNIEGFVPIVNRSTHCVANANNTSPVQAMVHYKDKYIFVCTKYLLVYKTYKPSKIVLFQDEELIIDRKSSKCPDIYEPFCIRSTSPPDTLIEAVAVPSMNGTQILVAYFGEREISENYRYNREYEVRAYVDGQLIFRDKMMGLLSAIDIIGIQDNKVRGLISKNDGMTCPFEYQIGHENNYNFEPLIDNTLCRSLQTFLACPQAWCADAFLEASFTVKDQKYYEMVYLLLFKNLWIIPAKRRLPIDLPRNDERIFLPRVAACEYKTPGGLWSNDPNIVPCCMKNTLASFGMQINHTEYVLSFHPYVGWRTVINRTEDKKHHDKKSDLNVKGLIGDSSFYNANALDAAWWDKTVQILYLFSGLNYFAFKVNGPVNKNTSWTSEKNGTLKDMGLIYDGQVEDGLDAVISMNGNNYFFNQRFRFYEIPDGQTKFKGQPKLIQMHFFRTLSQCYYNDYEAYEALLNRLGEKLPEKKLYNRKPQRIPKKRTKKPLLKSLSAKILAIIIAFSGLVITVAGLTYIYVLEIRRQEKMKQKTVSSRQQKKSKLDTRSKEVTRSTSKLDSKTDAAGHDVAKVASQTPTEEDAETDIAKQIELGMVKDEIQVFFKRQVR